MTHPVLYGIKNCDTVKKARKWLEANAVDYLFHDFRADGLAAPLLQDWLQTVGIDTLVNKRSTTWKQLTATEQQNVLAGNAIPVLLANPTLIKRPVLAHDNEITVGFKESLYAERLASR